MLLDIQPSMVSILLVKRSCLIVRITLRFPVTLSLLRHLTPDTSYAIAPPSHSSSERPNYYHTTMKSAKHSWSEERWNRPFSYCMRRYGNGIVLYQVLSCLKPTRLLPSSSRGRWTCFRSCCVEHTAEKLSEPSAHNKKLAARSFQSLTSPFLTGCNTTGPLPPPSPRRKRISGRVIVWLSGK